MDGKDKNTPFEGKKETHAARRKRPPHIAFSLSRATSRTAVAVSSTLTVEIGVCVDTSGNAVSAGLLKPVCC